MADRLLVRGAREHNLKNVSIDLPRDSLIVFTGLSGSPEPTPYEAAYVAVLDNELLNGKRPHEMLLIQTLLERSVMSRGEYVALLQSKGCVNDEATVDSVERILTLDFFTEAEMKKYGPNPIINVTEQGYRLDRSFRDYYRGRGLFRAHVDDAIETALYLAHHDESWAGTLVVGHQYTRKDVCRMLNFESNQYSTLYGYKADKFSRTCPIFITHDKSEDITDTTKYEDGFDSEATIHWFTKNNRSLTKSQAEIDIAHNRYALHVFVKKSDVDGADFFYLGQAVARDAQDTAMPGTDVPIITMKLDLQQPVEPGLFGYLAAADS